MAEGFTKLFSTIVTSTIWREDDKTRIIWITMLALADADGKVDASIPGLADAAHVSLGRCEKALTKLLSSDKYSRTQEFEGRRIKEVDGGWLLLNYRKYREKLSQEERREYLRVKQAEHRAREKGISDSKTPYPQNSPKKEAAALPQDGRTPPNPANSTPLSTICQQMSTDVSDKSTPSTQAEAEAEAEAEAIIQRYMSIFDQGRIIYPGTKRGLQTEFDNFIEHHKDWQMIVSLLQPAIEVLIATRRKATARNEFVPPWKNFKTWINNRCWEEAEQLPPKAEPHLCACGCGKPALNCAANKWFASNECRIKVLGW